MNFQKREPRWQLSLKMLFFLTTIAAILPAAIVGSFGEGPQIAAVLLILIMAEALVISVFFAVIVFFTLGPWVLFAWLIRRPIRPSKNDNETAPSRTTRS